MESQLSTDTRALDAHKAWHLLGVLLTIGRPVSPTELASRCTSFRASPEFVAFLCSIYRSPLLLTESGSVSISPIGYIEFRRIVLNLGNHSILVPRMRVVFSEPQGLLDDVACRCYRKRSRDGEIEYLPAVKKRALLQNLEDSGKEIVLSTCNVTDKAAKEVHINRITQESSLVITCSSEEYDKTKVAATSVEKSSISLLNCILNNNVPESQSNMLLDMKEFGYVNTLEQQINFPDNENFMHLLDARQTEVVEADMLHQEPSPLPSKLHCPVFLVEDKMSAPYSRIGINLNDPYIPEVDECMDMSLLEAYNTLCACETVAKSGDVERVRKCREEEKIVDYGRCKIDVEYLSTKPINMDMTKPDDYNYNNIMRSNEVLPFLDGENTTYKTQAILSAELRSVNKQQEQYKIDKRSSSKKQKLRLDFQEKKRQGEDSKRHKSKEISGKPVSMIKNQVECKSFPNFDSFTVEEKEGSGGYGTVYRAKRKQDGLTLAIKCPHDNSNKHHIYNEMKMLERFGGKNFIIKYEGSFKYENVHCLVLEHVEHDRPEVLKKEINASQVQWYGYCLFRALASLHKQGVVHRDVKPGNFLFSCNANKGYLIDFNLAVDLHQKHGYTNKSTTGCDMGFNNVQLSHVKSLPPSKGRKFSTSKAAESINQEAGKGYKSSLSKNFKTKTYHNEKADLGARSNVKSQGADGSGITSAKDATSSRLPSGERLREPMPCQGRKELISLAQEAMQGPTQEVVRVPASKRKRVAASPEIVDKKLTYLTPMPLIFTDAGHMKNKGESKQKREGPCAGTKGFRAPEVLFRSPYQGPKLDIWSAGVTLLYLITGRSPFVGDPDQNIKEIAKLRGSEDLWEVAKLHNRESSFPMELFDMKYLPSKDLRDWCGLNTKKPDVLQDIPMPFFDLIDKCLTVNPRSRISAEEALKHEFFAPCHRQLRKHRLLRQGLSLDSKTTLLSIQPDTIETL